MTRAIALADDAAAAGDVPVGAILVVDGRAFEAHNEKEARRDPTAHAELLALRAAAAALGRWRLGGTLYVTKEPCAMCAGAIAAARIERLVFGCSDPKGGAAGGWCTAAATPKAGQPAPSSTCSLHVPSTIASRSRRERWRTRPPRNCAHSSPIAVRPPTASTRAAEASRAREGTPSPGTDIQGSRRTRRPHTAERWSSG